MVKLVFFQLSFYQAFWIFVIVQVLIISTAWLLLFCPPNHLFFMKWTRVIFCIQQCIETYCDCNDDKRIGKGKLIIILMKCAPCAAVSVTVEKRKSRIVIWKYCAENWNVFVLAAKAIDAGSKRERDREKKGKTGWGLGQREREWEKKWKITELWTQTLCDITV